MRTLPAIHWLLLLCLATTCFTGCATVKTKDELTESEIAALEESQSRLIAYRQQIETARQAADRHSIQELQELVRQELDLQGAIITRDSQARIKACELRDHLKQVAIAAPVIVAFLGMAVLESLAQANTTITP